MMLLRAPLCRVKRLHDRPTHGDWVDDRSLFISALQQAQQSILQLAVTPD